MVAHQSHRRLLADLQRNFDTAQGEAEEIAARVVTGRIERAFGVEGPDDIRLGVGASDYMKRIYLKKEPGG